MRDDPVQTQEEFEAALGSIPIDMIFSDYTMPKFDGLSALKMVKVRWPDLPVILVSATLGEERAIESLKSGATDYVLKDGLRGWFLRSSGHARSEGAGRTAAAWRHSSSRGKRWR